MSEPDVEFSIQEVDALRRYFRSQALREFDSRASEEDAPAKETEKTIPEEIYNLPDDETLIRFADGTLWGSERKQIQKLAQESLTCLSVVAAFVKEYSAVRRASQRGCGWKGPYLSVLDRLPEEVSREDWRQHLERNPRARLRENLLRTLLGERLVDAHGNEARRRVWVSLGRQFALAAVPLLLFLAVTHLPFTTTGKSGDVIPKGDASTTPPPPVPDATELTNMSDEKLETQLDRYRNANSPTSCGYLASLYLEKARRTQEPESKAEYRTRASELYKNAWEMSEKK